MNKKEIKEILEQLKDSVDYPKFDIPTFDGTDSEFIDNDTILEPDKCKLLLDYITNLQQKVEQLENIRKEAIEATKDVKQFVYDELVDRNVSGATETHCKIMDLLNILNKGSE